MYCDTKLIQPYCYKIGGNNSLIHVAIKGESGTNYMFRYFKLHIYEIQDESGTPQDTVQFSKLKFIDANKNAFEYPPEMIGYPRYGKREETLKYGFSVCDSQEYPVAGTSDALNSKCCMDTNGYGDHYILYDLGSECLNVKTFNRWSWWNSNDSASTGRYMYKFAMYISNDLNNWIAFDVNHKEDGCEFQQYPLEDYQYIEMYVSDYFDYRGKL